MGSPKKTRSKDSPVEPKPESSEDAASPEPAARAPHAASPSATGSSSRKSVGAKEPIPFKWKLLGESGGIILTLYKSVEREEIDGQLDRLTREGYYANLRIVDIDQVIKQTTSAKAALAAHSDRSKAPGRTRKTKKTAAKPARGRSCGKATRPAKASAARKTTTAGRAPVRKTAGTTGAAGKAAKKSPSSSKPSRRRVKKK